MEAQQEHLPIAVIDAKPQVTKEDLLNVIAELKEIISEAIKTLS